MRDGTGRTIDYLRISVTDRCNFRCRYCMPEDLPLVPHERILRFEEVLRLCRIAGTLGFTRFRVTGGEPLVRRGTGDFLASLRDIPGVEVLALTTNGSLLEENMAVLSRARLDAVNISLDTLDPVKFRALTGIDALDSVLRGIDAAHQAGIFVKLNCVVMRGVNEDDVLPLAALAQERELDVRFIELMPLGAGRGYQSVSGAEVFARLASIYPDMDPVQGAAAGGPARYYQSRQLKGRIGFINAVSGHFCGECNRVRLSSEGYLKLCLCDSDGVDLRAMLRGGSSDEEIGAAMVGAIGRKPLGHQFGTGADDELDGLSKIGG